MAEGTANEVEFGLKTILDQLDAEQDLSDAELRFAQAQQALVLNAMMFHEPPDSYPLIRPC